MDKKILLAQMRLLSALESWSLSAKCAQLIYAAMLAAAQAKGGV